MKIRIESVSFAYPSGVQALVDIGLSIDSGEAVAIVGENGAGKTTLVKHLNGLLLPKTGEVWVGEHNTKEFSTARLAQHVGYAFQNPDDQLFERTVWKEVAFGPRNLKFSEPQVEERVNASLEEVGLTAENHTHPYDLHPSQRKLVAIAATLAMDTPIAIFDEPTTGQDAFGVAIIGRIIERLRSKGNTVITISHDLDFCAEYFERMVVMSSGRILIDGPSRDILVQTALLQEAAIDPPQLVRLALSLNQVAAPRTPSEFVDLYAYMQRSSPNDP